MIVLHHLNRSRSFRILWLLEELGLEYELKSYRRDAKTNLAPPELSALHPLGKSPLLELDGRVIAESAAIVETLCARFAPQMIPETSSDAYISHLEAMHFAEGSVMTPILLNLYVGRLGEAGAPLHPRINDELTSHFAYMEQSLRPSGHFVLDQLSAADIMLSFPAQIALRLDRGADFPRLSGFVQAMSARPAFQAALAKAGPDA
ncbi:glutathione S-transferase [Rhodobacteraceae bacterium D3-12]|nr:glutathione S-transferase [Rhodobacteraceae bacterium D3-12]